MNKTKNDMPLELREKMILVLSERLADTSDLQSQAKQAHWNVKGPDFIALHKLFDEVYTEVGEYVDMIAERIVQLGGTAEGTVRVAAKRSSLSEYPLDITAGRDHVAAFSDVLAAYSKLVREAIDRASEAGDADTADIFTEVSRGVDKSLWFVEAHLG